MSQVVGEIMLNISAELRPEVRMKLEDLEQLGHVDTLQETVSQSSHISAGLDNIIAVGCCCVWRLDERNVAAN